MIASVLTSSVDLVTMKPAAYAREVLENSNDSESSR